MKTVYDLTKYEFNSLKEEYFDQLVCCGEDIELGVKRASDIPDETIFRHYSECTFSEFDFL